MHDYFTTAQVAKLLNVSISTVYQLRRRGFPFHKLGRRTIRYERQEVQEWINETAHGMDRASLEAISLAAVNLGNCPSKPVEGEGIYENK